MAGKVLDIRKMNIYLMYFFVSVLVDFGIPHIVVALCDWASNAHTHIESNDIRYSILTTHNDWYHRRLNAVR